jgi:FAD/FMN-containing dehydrogenase
MGQKEIESILNDVRSEDRLRGSEAAARLHKKLLEDSDGTLAALHEALRSELPEPPPEPEQRGAWSWLWPWGGPQYVESMHNAQMPMPREVLTPKTRAELRDRLDRAAEARLSMRAAGSELSFSNVAFTEGVFLRLGQHLNRVFEVEKDILDAKIDPDRLVSFEAGATIQQINDWLTARDRALMQQPAFGGLSYVGAMTVGGHGSGVLQGPIADYVRSLRVFTIEDGEVVDLRIEPRSGAITDADAWKKLHPDVPLVQDDELFWSCVVSAGCLGVIHEVTIETRESFFLVEDRTVQRWDDAKKVVDALVKRPTAELHNVSIFVNPYRVDAGSPYCILARYPYTSSRTRSGERGLAILYGGVPPFAQAVSLIAYVDPAAIPALVDGALRATAGQAVLPSTEALDQGSPNYISVVAAASGVAVDRWIEATEAVMELLKQRAAEKGHYVESPMGLRFVRKSSAYLAPSHAADTCMIETPCLRGTPHALETLAEIHEMLARDFDGRPHWGQIMQRGPEVLLKKDGTPRFPEFVRSFERMNTSRLFDNAFTRQVGLSR